MNCPHANVDEQFDLTWCKDCGSIRYVQASGWTQPQVAKAQSLAREAWMWLSGTHPMIVAGGSYSTRERVAKAETCLSTAVEWEDNEAPTAWASEEIDR